MPRIRSQYAVPRIKLFQSLKLLINPGTTDRALEKFLNGNQIVLSAGQLVPAMQAAIQTFPKLEIADKSRSH